jgi:hypothetical protein
VIPVSTIKTPRPDDRGFDHEPIEGDERDDRVVTAIRRA